MPKRTLFTPTKGDGRMNPQQLGQAADLSRDSPNPPGRNPTQQAAILAAAGSNRNAGAVISGSTGSAPSPGVNTPTSSAGGDLGGAYPNPTVVSVGDVTNGVLSVVNGGTGQSNYSDGQLLLGNSLSAGLALATLTPGANITITNGHGTITISAAASGGSGNSPLFNYYNCI